MRSASLLSISKLASLVLLIVGLVGCTATVPIAPKVIDDSAKQFVVPADQSVIYVVRENAYKGKAILFQVGIDGKMLGGIAAGTYFAETVTPGEHTVTAISNENQDSLKVVTSAGVATFVKVEPRWGMVTAKVGLKPIEPQLGKHVVTTGAMAAGLK